MREDICVQIGAAEVNDRRMMNIVKVGVPWLRVQSGLDGKISRAMIINRMDIEEANRRLIVQ